MTAETAYLQDLSEDYYRIAEAIEYLERNFKGQPTLTEVAEHLHMSEYHTQRLFKRWAGISPKRFLQYLTKEYAKDLLLRGEGILETSTQSGLSGPGRLHDLFVACEAVSPGEFKRLGEGVLINYGFHPTPFGECMIGVTRRGVVNLSFTNAGNRSFLLDEMKADWPFANFVEDSAITQQVVSRIFIEKLAQAQKPVQVLIKGTNFQIKVWEALLRIPTGYVVSYEDIAVYLGVPNSYRAVGNAVGENKIPVLIPCHRVIRKKGTLGGYRWGNIRKQAILTREFIDRESSFEFSQL